MCLYRTLQDTRYEKGKASRVGFSCVCVCVLVVVVVVSEVKLVCLNQRAQVLGAKGLKIS